MGIESDKLIHMGHAADFLDRITIVISNSESTLMLDALARGIPAVYFGSNASPYIKELSNLSPDLFFCCQNIPTLERIVEDAMSMTSAERRKHQQIFIKNANTNEQTIKKFNNTF